MQLDRFLTLFLCGLAALACNDSDPIEPPEPVARLRIVNAAPGTLDVDVLRSGSSSPIASLDYRASTTSCVQIPSGNLTLTFRSGATELATEDFTFADGGRYSVFLSTADGHQVATIVSDEETAAEGLNFVRFVNATSAAGDVYTGPPTGGLGNKVHGNLAVVGKTNVPPLYVGVPTTLTRVQLFDVGVTTGTPRADLTLTALPASRKATVVFVNVGTPTAFIVTPCE
jgi:hypothetical protein